MNKKKKPVAEGEEAKEGEEGAEGEGAAEAEAEAPAEEEEEEQGEMSPRTLSIRVDALSESITYQAFNYCRRGTFEAHKLIISTMLCFRILIRHKKVKEEEVNALIKKDVAMEPPHQAESLKFIPEAMWGAVKGLENIKIFEHLI